MGNKVYDFSEYMRVHGGGAATIIPVCGADGDIQYEANGVFHTIPFSGNSGLCVGKLSAQEKAILSGTAAPTPVIVNPPTYNAPPTTAQPTPAAPVISTCGRLPPLEAALSDYFTP